MKDSNHKCVDEGLSGLSGANKDNFGRCASASRGRVAGEVNGPDTQEFPEFNPTKHELIVLLKYWTEIAVAIEHEWFLDGKCTSADPRLYWLAWSRVSRVSKLLGSEIYEPMKEVYWTYGSRQDKHDWEAYRNRSQEDRAALQLEIQLSMRQGSNAG